MLVIVAGRTAPNRAVCFGGEHRDLDARGRRDVRALAAEVSGALAPGPLVSGPLVSGEAAPGETVPAVRSGPEDSVWQSAELLVAAPAAITTDPGLASLDVGSWRGRTPEEIPGAELGAWFADPAVRPHGGESIAGFVARIRHHAATLPDDAVLVVAKPVAQALLCTGVDDFFRTRVLPASLHRC